MRHRSANSLADDVRGEVEKLIVEGHVPKDSYLYELTPKGENILADRGGGLNVARAVRASLTNWRLR